MASEIKREFSKEEILTYTKGNMKVDVIQEYPANGHIKTRFTLTRTNPNNGGISFLTFEDYGDAYNLRDLLTEALEGEKP